MADAVGGELERLFRASSRHADDDLVFADPHTGGPLDKAAILRRYRKALAAAKLDGARRFHDLRHTFGTRMAAAGVPMRTLQEWMGHRDIETTQRYADYAPSPHEAALVAAAFGEEGAGVADEDTPSKADPALVEALYTGEPFGLPRARPAIAARASRQPMGAIQDERGKEVNMDTHPKSPRGDARPERRGLVTEVVVPFVVSVAANQVPRLKPPKDEPPRDK